MPWPKKHDDSAMDPRHSFMTIPPADLKLGCWLQALVGLHGEVVHGEWHDVVSQIGGDHVLLSDGWDVLWDDKKTHWGFSNLVKKWEISCSCNKTLVTKLGIWWDIDEDREWVGLYTHLWGWSSFKLRRDLCTDIPILF